MEKVKSERMRRRILHTADWHFRRLDDNVSRCLVAIVDLASKTKVDLVIVAGDLFDYNRVGDNLVSFVIERLEALPVPTFILPGNHDCLDSDSVYHRAELWKDTKNVRIFLTLEGETLTLPGLSVWGKPITSFVGNLRPLAGIPQPHGKGQWHIAVAHGSHEPFFEPAILSGFHISREDIITSGQDYIALGHYATFKCVYDAPLKVYYCDSPYGAYPHTVNIVDFIEGTGVQVKRVTLHEGERKLKLPLA